MRPRAAAVALAALALATLAIGCGGEDDDEFKDEYRSASGRIQATGNDIPAALRGTSGKQSAEAASRLANLAKRAQTSVGELRALDPPKDLADDRDALARALEVGAEDLRGIASAARAGSKRRTRAATRKLIKDSRAIRNARGRLDFLIREE